MTPANVVVLTVPSVRVWLPNVTLLPATPVKSLIVAPPDVPEISKVPPEAMVTPEEVAIDPVPVKLIVPALIEVRPV